MTPIYLNSSPSPFPAEPNDQDQTHHHFLSPNSQAASSSSSLSCQVFFNSTTHDQTGYNYHPETPPPQLQLVEGDDFGSRSNDHMERINEENGGDLKFSVWKKEITNDNPNQLKWMSSKMRLMLKMKKSDPMDTSMPISSTNNNNAATELKLEDHYHQKVLPSSPVETDNSSNTSSSNIPIRVCSDCNTTKTPLWRSGPRGPKSLCNACGIRQRKARRAMAAAAAENGTIFPIESATTSLKTKIRHKDKKSNVTKYKKRHCKIMAGTPPSSSPSPSLSPGRKNCFEDFVIRLSENLAFHRVFPQDEKEAAILLMALSCGYVHG